MRLINILIRKSNDLSVNTSQWWCVNAKVEVHTEVGRQYLNLVGYCPKPRVGFSDEVVDPNFDITIVTACPLGPSRAWIESQESLSSITPESIERDKAILAEGKVHYKELLKSSPRFEPDIDFIIFDKGMVTLR